MSNTTDKLVTTAWEKLGVTTLPLASIPTALDILWEMETKITMCLIGDTGVGKTPIVHQWVKNRGGYIRVLNFGHMSPEEISMSMFSDDASYHEFVPPKFILDLNEQAEKTGLAVLYLDEWNRALDKSLTNNLFTLTDERRIHNFFLHKNVLVVAAMNPSDGTYLVNEAERDHAIRKRLNFVFVTPDLSSWLKFARSNSFHPMVCDFVHSQANLFYDAPARDAGKVFPCPANWEKVSNICKSAEKLGLLLEPTTRALVAGQIGYTAASKFFEFVVDKNTVIQPSEVIENYYTTGRNRIAGLLGSKIGPDSKFVRDPSKTVRADVIANLNEGVAITLLSSQPNPAEIVKNIAGYLSDVPIEFAMSFLAEHLRKNNDSESTGKYIAALSAYLNKEPAYHARMVEMQEAHREIRNKTKAHDKAQ